MAWLYCTIREPQLIQFFKSVFLEILNVPIRSVLKIRSHMCRYHRWYLLVYAFHIEVTVYLMNNYYTRDFYIFVFDVNA